MTTFNTIYQVNYCHPLGGGPPAPRGTLFVFAGVVLPIIKVIDEAAFQTNNVALNAMVEVTRAGEADRNPAQRSAQAASEESNAQLQAVKGVAQQLEKMPGTLGHSVSAHEPIPMSSRTSTHAGRVNIRRGEFRKVSFGNHAR